MSPFPGFARTDAQICYDPYQGREQGPIFREKIHCEVYEDFRRVVGGEK